MLDELPRPWPAEGARAHFVTQIERGERVDDATLERFRDQAYQQAQKFSIQNILPQYLELYESVVAK